MSCFQCRRGRHAARGARRLHSRRRTTSVNARSRRSRWSELAEPAGSRVLELHCGHRQLHRRVSPRTGQDPGRCRARPARGPGMPKQLEAQWAAKHGSRSATRTGHPRATTTWWCSTHRGKGARANVSRAAICCRVPNAWSTSPATPRRSRAIFVSPRRKGTASTASSGSTCFPKQRIWSRSFAWFVLLSAKRCVARARHGR